MSNEHNISAEKLKITTNRYISVSQKSLMSTITDGNFKFSFTWSTLLTSALNILKSHTFQSQRLSILYMYISLFFCSTF